MRSFAQARDEHTAAAVAGGLSRKRKQPPKPLRCEVIAGTKKVKQVSSKDSVSQQGKSQVAIPQNSKHLKQQHQGKGVYKLPAAATYDLWDKPAQDGDPRLDKHNNIPGVIDTLASRPAKRQKKAHKSIIKAVAIDPAGCSYNPDAELHQEAVAQAVASEMQKVHRQDLQPSKIPQFVSYPLETDELALLQVDAEPDEEDGTDSGTAAPGNAGSAAEVAGKVTSMREKRSKKDRGLEVRNRLLREEAQKKQQLKAQRRDIDNVKQLQQDLEAEALARWAAYAGCTTQSTQCT